MENDSEGSIWVITERYDSKLWTMNPKGGLGTRPSLGPIFFNKKIAKVIGWNPFGVGTRPSGKSWIRPCMRTNIKHNLDLSKQNLDFFENTVTVTR